LTKINSKLDLDLLLTYLYCTLADDFLVPERGRPQGTNDAELVCLAIAGVLLGCPTERGWLRRAHQRLGHLFPQIPKIAQYNKRIRRLTPMLERAISLLAAQYPETRTRFLIVDTTPIPCSQSKETVNRSRLGPGVVSRQKRAALRADQTQNLADYGYCAAHKRHYWGFKLATLITPSGFPVTATLVSGSLAEQDALRALLKIGEVQEKTIIGDKGFRGKKLEQEINKLGADLIRPDFKNEKPRFGRGARIRQHVESTYQTLKGQLSLEKHGARTLSSLTARITQRLCALAAALWLNYLFDQPGRHLTAYDH
jgi:Transposase DDE domain.